MSNKSSVGISLNESLKETSWFWLFKERKNYDEYPKMTPNDNEMYFWVLTQQEHDKEYILGVYSSKTNAQDVVKQILEMTGEPESCDRFFIYRYTLNNIPKLEWKLPLFELSKEKLRIH